MMTGVEHRITYFKRFRMEIALEEAPPPSPLPPGYSWVAWSPNLLEQHAEVKCRSFSDEIDSVVFPNLSHLQGCLLLMQEISRRPGFRPEATWLIRGPEGHCGTVQGIGDRLSWGAIQNLGVLPLHRGLGLGSALLLQALEGFRRSGLGRAYLEVTAQNEGAVRIYRRLGFRCRKTLYKAVDVNADFAPAPALWPAQAM